MLTYAAAGGRTVEALRSVVISQQLLGTREIVIIHHVSSIFRLAYLETYVLTFHHPD